MISYTAQKAEAVRPDSDYIDDAYIQITGAASPATPEVFARDAAEIARALWSHLPGGTLDALLGELLRRRASQLIVPLAAQESTNV